MREPKWADDFTLRDILRKVGEETLDVPNTYKVLYLMGKERDDKANTESSHAIIDYLYERYGRPKWFVDQDVFELLNTLEIDDSDLSGIFFPHDVFTLLFERGTMLEGKPLRSIRIMRLAANMSFNFMKEIFILMNAEDSGIRTALTLFIDAGEDGFTGKFSWDTPILSAVKTHQRRQLKDPGHKSYLSNTVLNAEELKYVQRATQLVASALLYQAARPDCVAEYTLPRSCRYTFKGEPGTYRRLLCPKPPTRDGAASGGSGAVPTGRTVTGHYRGWVLRTLRAERYKRNPDGTLRVVLVEPCAIAGGPQEREQK